MPHTVLVVDSDPSALAGTARVLRDAGFLVSTSGSFEAAHPRVQFAAPELLVTCVRLGTHNGIQLVIRGRADNANMQAIVIDVAFDPVLDREARAAGAVYLERPTAAEAVGNLARAMMTSRPARVATPTPRRWPRKDVTRELIGTLGQTRGRIVNLGYGGVRLEIPGGQSVAPMQGRIEFVVPSAGISLRSTPVWALRPNPGSSWWCGLDVSDSDSLVEWRAFVDSVC